ncbi:MAG: hypothetical protein LBH17_05055 [Oscillospiraceae bacterium]|nr:hypothetical protein [Oscillospiraceae bacterium]
MLSLVAEEGFAVPGAGSRGARRNAGLASAATEFIAFADAGDDAAPGYFDALISAAVSHGADIAVGSGGDIDEASVSGERVLDAPGALLEHLRGGVFSESLTGIVLRRRLFEGVSFPENVQLCDLPVCYKLYAAAGTAVVVGGLIYRRGFTEPDERDLTADYIVEHLAAYREREEFISARFPELRDAARHAEWAYMLSSVEKITRLGLARCYAPLRYMRNELKTYKQTFWDSPYTTERERAMMQMYV